MRFSTEAAKPPLAATIPPKPALLPRILIFSAFSLTLSLGALGYTLVTDETTLFWARDNFPRAVNLVAPLLGLPQETIVSSSSSPKKEGETVFSEDDDEDANKFTDIKEIVGDKVYVCFKLASGQVVILECNADDTPTQLRAKVLEGRPQGERVLDMAMLDAERALWLLEQSPEELARTMNHVAIPEIPEVITVNSVGVALELCRQTEIDLEVRLRLSQSESDTINIKRALAEIDARKALLKKLLKEERSKLGVQSIFRRNR